MNRLSSPLVTLRNVLLAALAAWAIANVYVTVQYIVNDYSPTPLYDYWREAQLWPLFKASHWFTFWAQHNEHRIIFPEMVYVADMFWLHGRMCLPIILSGCFYFGVWLILAIAAYSSSIVRFPAREVSLLLAAVIMSWKSCSTLIATPFELQFTILQFMAALSLSTLALFADRQKSLYLAIVISAAIIGTYSSGNGMLLWPVLIAGGYYLRLPRQAMVALAVSAALSIGLYFVDYHFMPNYIGINLRHPILAFEFVCSFLGMPFGAVPSWRPSVLYGAANIALMLVAFVVTWKSNLLRSRLGTTVFGLYFFTLLSAMLTAGSRMDIHDGTFATARAWRYVTMPMVGWALLAVTAIWLAGELISTPMAWILATAIALLIARGFHNASPAVEASREDFGNAQIVNTMFANDVFDNPQVSKIFPSAAFVKANLPLLQADRKMFYAQGTDKWLGRSVDELKPSYEPVSGAITRITPFEGGLEIVGWAENAWLTGDHAVLFVDADRHIVGFGSRPKAYFPPSNGTYDTPDKLAFTGFVARKRMNSPLSIYVRTAHGRVLRPLEGSIPAPNFIRSDSEPKKRPLLADIVWRENPNWTLRGYTVTSENTPAPPGDIYASYSGSDAKTGSFSTDPIPTPNDHCLIVPTLTGGSAYGQSVRIIDADTQQSLADFPLNGAAWQRWRVSIPTDVKNFQIQATDLGASLFQWVAVATPEQCQ